MEAEDVGPGTLPPKNLGCTRPERGLTQTATVVHRLHA